VRVAAWRAEKERKRERKRERRRERERGRRDCMGGWGWVAVGKPSVRF
jgi:hypothetical protein